jgi:hypothetical protein
VDVQHCDRQNGLISKQPTVDTQSIDELDPMRWPCGQPHLNACSRDSSFKVPWLCSQGREHVDDVEPTPPIGDRGRGGNSPRGHELGGVPPGVTIFRGSRSEGVSRPPGASRETTPRERSPSLEGTPYRHSPFCQGNEPPRARRARGRSPRGWRGESSLTASESSTDFPRGLRVPLPCSPWFNHRCCAVSESSRITPRHRADLALTRTRNLPWL